MKQYLYGYDSQLKAYWIQDHPWGGTFRTQIRYWVESKKGKGQRFVKQSMNPNTGAWCAPKKSTYYPIAIMYLDEKNHINWAALNRYNSEKTINEFKETHFDQLDEFQKQSLKEIIAFEKVMRNLKVTYEIMQPGQKDIGERQKEQEEALKNINRAIHFEMNKIPF